MILFSPQLLRLVDEIRTQASTARVKTRILVQVSADVAVGPTVTALTSAKHKCGGLHAGMGGEELRQAATDFR